MTDIAAVTAGAAASTATAPTSDARSGTGAPPAPPARRRRPLSGRLRETGGRVVSAVLAAHDAGVPF